jgi:hypothetical protein
MALESRSCAYSEGPRFRHLGVTKPPPLDWTIAMGGERQTLSNRMSSSSRKA